MTITELLEAHLYGGLADVSGEYEDWTIKCLGCDWQDLFQGDQSRAIHRAHVAEVLEQHMQELDSGTAGKLRRVMNGRYSSFDDTYTIHRRGLENIVLELEGREPFTDEEESSDGR